MRVSRGSVDPPPEPDVDGQTQASDVDVDMDDDVPKQKAAPRKKKKTVPVGKNGLNKRRVVKSKTSFDAKGYMGAFIAFL